MPGKPLKRKDRKDLRGVKDILIRRAVYSPFRPLYPSSPYASSGTSPGRSDALGAAKVNTTYEKKGE
jgi:hypothetical protein